MVVSPVLLSLAALPIFVRRPNTTSPEKPSLVEHTAAASDLKLSKNDAQRQTDDPPDETTSQKLSPDSRSSNAAATPRNIQFTGVKKELILALLQCECDMGGYRSQFAIAGQDEHQAMLKDKYTDLYLLPHGPERDLEGLTLMMPLKSFAGFDETGTRLIGNGAAAFGRVMQRLITSIDPSWTEDLYAWMNEQMGRG